MIKKVEIPAMNGRSIEFAETEDRIYIAVSIYVAAKKELTVLLNKKMWEDLWEAKYELRSLEPQEPLILATEEEDIKI